MTSHEPNPTNTSDQNNAQGTGDGNRGEGAVERGDNHEMAEPSTTGETDDTTQTGESSERATELTVEDSVELSVPEEITRADVWEICSDPAVLAECIPGAESVEQLSERRYRGTVTRGVHSITVSMDGEVELVEQHEPDWILAEGQAYDPRSHSDFNGLGAMEIEMINEGTVGIHYRLKVTLSGGVATVPARILRRIVDRDVGMYFENIHEKLRTS